MMSWLDAPNKPNNKQLMTRKNMKNKWIKLGGTVATVLALTASVQAIPSAPSFQISLNGTTWTSEINGFFGSFGSFTTVQLGATITGTGANPILDLSTLNVAGTGTLYVEMSATGIGPTTAPYFAHLGGNIGGSDSVTWNSYVSSLNTLYATSPHLLMQLVWSELSIHLNPGPSINRGF